MRKMVGRLAALAAAGALTFAALPVTSASAGTNGQHVSFCGPPPEAEWGGITGSNQDGQWTAETLPMEEVDIDPIVKCAYSDWWWKGDVIIWFQGPHGLYPEEICRVPESWGANGFYPC